MQKIYEDKKHKNFGLEHLGNDTNNNSYKTPFLTISNENQISDFQINTQSIDLNDINKSKYNYNNNIFFNYAKIKEIESENIENTDLSIPVDVKIFTDGVKKYRKEKGVFTLTAEKISFKSEISDLYFEYTTEEQEGLAYSVNEEFELYYRNELYYFYPEKNSRKICTRVALIFEMLKKSNYEK